MHVVTRPNLAQKFIWPVNSLSLIFLDRNPICSTNLPGNEAIGENDCKLDADKVKISCGIGYYGNISPKMECRNTGSNALLQSQVAKDTGSFISITFEIGELSYFSSNSHVCQLMDGVDDDTGHLVYRMENITVLSKNINLEGQIWIFFRQFRMFFRRFQMFSVLNNAIKCKIIYI